MQLEARADALLAAGDTDSSTASRAIARINTALMQQERALTTEVGMPRRPWFRHQIYAPGLVTGYAVQYLPGMRDAVEQDDRTRCRPTAICCSTRCARPRASRSKAPAARTGA